MWLVTNEKQNLRHLPHREANPTIITTHGERYLWEMNMLRSQVRKIWGLCCITECEQDPPRVLKRTRIDEDDEQNPTANKRPRLSTCSERGNAGSENTILASKRKKLPSEAPPHRRRSILVVKPKGSKIPKVKVLPPCPGTSPITSPNRGRDENLLWRNWKPLTAKRKSKAQVCSLKSHHAVQSGSLSQVKPTPKALQPSEVSDEVTNIQNEPPSSNVSDCNIQIKSPELLETDLFGDPLPIPDPNTANVAFLSKTVAYAAQTGIKYQPTKDDYEQPSPEAPKIGLNLKQEFREVNELRRSQRLQPSRNSGHTPSAQKDINSTADLLVQIAIICSEHGTPDEMTILQLHKLLQTLPVLLTSQGRKDQPIESAKFRATMNQHELSLNWGDLDSIEELHNNICSMVTFGPRVNQTPYQGVDGCVEI